MSRDVLDLAEKMDQQGMEWQMAVQCAPLITGLKISNLMMLPAACEDALADLLQGTDLERFVLGRTEHKLTVLVYRKEELYAVLKSEWAGQILTGEGYGSTDPAGLLAELGVRYMNCRNGRSGFPHEMGIFLGYPEEDVRGFMEHNGREFLLAGYWKVYADPAKKEKLFAAYDRACDTLIRLVHSGRSIRNIISIYRNKRDRMSCPAA